MESDRPRHTWASSDRTRYDRCTQRTKKERRAFFSRYCHRARESTLSSLWHLLQQAVALPSPTIGWLSMSFPAENDGLCQKRTTTDTEPVRSRVALAAHCTKRTRDAKRSSRERALGAFKLRAKSESEPDKWDRDPYTKASIPTRDIETEASGPRTRGTSTDRTRGTLFVGLQPVRTRRKGKKSLRRAPANPDRCLFPRQRLVTRNEERQIENATALQLLKLRRFTQRDPSEKSDRRDPIEQQTVVEMRAVQSIQRDAGGRPSLGMKTASHPVAYWQKTTIQCGLCPSPSDRRSANPSERNARLSYRSSSIFQSALRDVRCYCADCQQGRLPLGLSFFVKCLPCTHEMVRNIQTPSRKTDRNLMLHLLTSSHSSLLTYSRQATRFSAGPFG